MSERSATPVVILCGGQGTRMRGDTPTKKELVEIGDRPILWHVMRIFSAHDFNHFVLALGYEGQQIKRYFLDYEALTRDATLHIGGGDVAGRTVDFHGRAEHPQWHVSLRDTGLLTDKATRIALVADQLTTPRFFVTYGDGVGNVDLGALHRFHTGHGKLATVTAVQVTFQYGVIEADENGLATSIIEKPRLDHWVNAGFMLFERPVLELLSSGKVTDLERDLLPQLAAQGELMLYRHRGFWRSMDTYKEAVLLEDLWQSSAPWKMW